MRGEFLWGRIVPLALNKPVPRSMASCPCARQTHSTLTRQRKARKHLVSLPCCPASHAVSSGSIHYECLLSRDVASAPPTYQLPMQRDALLCRHLLFAYMAPGRHNIAARGARFGIRFQLGIVRCCARCTGCRPWWRRRSGKTWRRCLSCLRSRTRCAAS